MVRRLPSIDGAALVANKPQVRTFWESFAPEMDLTDPTPTLDAGVEKVWLDGRVTATLKDSVPQIGAPEAWAAGFDGTGVTVAVLDTGIDVNHPDLAGQIDDTASFVPGEAVTDVNGHGTHVAGTIVGTGAASGGDYKGVAPGADLIVGKVLGGAERRGPGLLGAGRHGVGRRVGRRHREHEPRRHDALRRDRPDVAGGRRALGAVRHALRGRRRATPARSRSPRRPPLRPR